MGVATPEELIALTAQREALQGELDLQSAYQDSIQKYGTLLSGPEEASSSATLTARINILKRSLPRAFRRWRRTGVQASDRRRSGQEHPATGRLAHYLDPRPS